MPSFNMLSFFALWLSLASHALATTRHFNLELTWKVGSPDGFEREMIFINNQYPGPALELTQGEWAEITVVNKLPFNTTIHYHGIDQQHTPWADGVPGLSQRPIQPGESYKYKWYANQYGSYFYHAHSRGQIDDGCYGPIVIKSKKGVAIPFDKIAPKEVQLLREAASNVKPIIVSDWRHTPSQHTMDLQIASGIESSICMDSILTNGKGAVNCWSREDITKFTSPAFAPLLAQLNLTMTNKGCLPSQLLEALGGAPGNLSALPAEVFDVCTPTKGSQEIIRAPRSKWLALDFISTASVDSLGVSIDEHPLWVYAADGQFIEPVKVDALNLLNGDRYSVFVELDKPASQYGIRIVSTAGAQLLNSTAILAYPGVEGCDVKTLSSIPTINAIGALISPTTTTYLDPLKAVPFPPQFPQPAPEADQTVIMSLGIAGRSYQWALNGTALNHAVVDDLSPPLLYQDPTSAHFGENVTIITKNNTWVDLVFKIESFPQPAHPIHKHSNKGYLIGQGDGAFNWTTVAQAAKAIPQNFNFVTPPFRDSFVTPAANTGPTWMAVRYHVENPGAFMLHCHIQSHLEGGMAMVMLDGVDEWPEVPNHYRN